MSSASKAILDLRVPLYRGLLETLVLFDFSRTLHTREASSGKGKEKRNIASASRPLDLSILRDLMFGATVFGDKGGESSVKWTGVSAGRGGCRKDGARYWTDGK